MSEIAYVDNISTTIFTPQISNIKKLERISMLEDNWDGDGAKPFPYDKSSTVNTFPAHTEDFEKPSMQDYLSLKYPEETEEELPDYLRQNISALMITFLIIFSV